MPTAQATGRHRRRIRCRRADRSRSVPPPWRRWKGNTSPRSRVASHHISFPPPLLPFYHIRLTASTRAIPPVSLQAGFDTEAMQTRQATNTQGIRMAGTRTAQNGLTRAPPANAIVVRHRATVVCVRSGPGLGRSTTAHERKSPHAMHARFSLARLCYLPGFFCGVLWALASGFLGSFLADGFLAAFFSGFALGAGGSWMAPSPSWPFFSALM